MTIDISLKNSEAHDLGFSAAGIAGHLRGDDIPYQPGHVDIMRDFLSSAYNGLERYCNQPKGSDLPQDFNNFSALYAAYLKSQKVDNVGEWFFQIYQFLESLKALKASERLDEEKRSELISLCDAVNKYTSSIIQSRPAT